MSIRPCTLKPVRSRSNAQAAPRARGTTNERGYDNDWKRLRLSHLAAEPLCRPCSAMKRYVPATVVDHIQDIVTHPHLRLVDENLQSMCAQCHNRKTHYTQRARRLKR